MAMSDYSNGSVLSLICITYERVSHYLILEGIYLMHCAERRVQLNTWPLVAPTLGVRGGSVVAHPYIAAHPTMVIDSRRMRSFEGLSSLSREVTRLDAVVADIVNQHTTKDL